MFLLTVMSCLVMIVSAAPQREDDIHPMFLSNAAATDLFRSQMNPPSLTGFFRWMHNSDETGSTDVDDNVVQATTTPAAIGDPVPQLNLSPSERDRVRKILKKKGTFLKEKIRQQQQQQNRKGQWYLG